MGNRLKERQLSMKQAKEHPIKAIRRAAVPIVAVETSDPAATVAGIKNALNGQASAFALVSWDIVGNLQGINSKGREAIQGYDPLTMQLPDILAFLAAKDTKDLLVFIHNTQNILARDGVTQGIWACRDAFKKRRCTLVLLAPSLKLPPELANDVIVIREPMPDREQITVVVDDMVKQAKTAGAAIGDDYPKDRVIDGLKGLGSLFDVEQTLALSIDAKGLDIPGVWQRKVDRLRATTGMEILIENPAFDALAGCNNVKAELTAFINGRMRPGCVVFMDEIEKAFGGAGTDSSGVATNMLGQWLSWTQDNSVRGFLLAGVPGAGKTWTGRTAAGEAKVPFCKLSMADLKGRWVGQSEQQLRSALDAVTALAGDGSILMIASANWIDQLTPDIMGRFTMGTFFYDFPSDEERSALWRMYISKHGLADSPPPSAGWVGREIENCCWRSWQTRRSLADVSQNIAPSCISQKAKLQELRKACSGRFLSADRPGLFDAFDGQKEAQERALKFN